MPFRFGPWPTRRTFRPTLDSDPHGPKWWVAHTKPRCEKRLEDYCRRFGVPCTLPLFKSVKRYGGRTRTFTKPFFPGYAFLHCPADDTLTALRSGHIANLLPVSDQATFTAQLQAILDALNSDHEVRLAPEIQAGQRVRIKSGSLRGMEAWVQDRRGRLEVLLRLDFIGQAAAVSIAADELEPV